MDYALFREAIRRVSAELYPGMAEAAALRQLGQVLTLYLGLESSFCFILSQRIRSVSFYLREFVTDFCTDGTQQVVDVTRRATRSPLGHPSV